MDSGRTMADELDALRKRVAELSAESVEWRQAFDAISDIIFILDADNTIRKVNKVFLDIFGLKAEEVIGRKCYELVHKSDKPWSLCPHVKAMQDHKPHTKEVDDPALGIPLLVTASPIFGQDGKVKGSVHIARNIADIRNARRELEDKIGQLESFQKVTMNRENRIIELKEEVEKLKDALSKVRRGGHDL